ncbi:hypothetical protein [Citrobacter amalonaticus]|uniref:hypothetical protein n=1 Tax=Citrobacter amalonaticus TaxID=35703 RepID=UPI0028C21A1F|nr:hypothetical protein [Citrobacter amalonaticus]MDT7071518.1 hypothetical protein [Citrobacter amalonaticus]
MSGKPAARQGDGTMKGGLIIQGSAGVMIGAPTGVACSVCPGGMTSGNGTHREPRQLLVRDRHRIFYLLSQRA